MKLCNWFIDVIRNRKLIVPRLFDLVPKLLMVLGRSERDMAVNGTQLHAYCDYFLERLATTRWDASVVLPMLNVLK